MTVIKLKDRLSRNSGSLNLLETKGLVQTCTGVALPLVTQCATFVDI
jgi:hypothetical protein